MYSKGDIVKYKEKAVQVGAEENVGDPEHLERVMRCVDLESNDFILLTPLELGELPRWESPLPSQVLELGIKRMSEEEATMAVQTYGYKTPGKPKLFGCVVVRKRDRKTERYNILSIEFTSDGHYHIKADACLTNLV